MKRNYAIDSLRGVIVALVVAHHAVLAYHPFAPPLGPSLASPPGWWRAFPVVDSHRWTGFSLFVGFNDTFFMALMFFLSGLFVWRGLERKGGAAFVRGRLLRLGLPFVAVAAVVAPLAYYPTYLQMPGRPGFSKEWLSQGVWPSGPAWFVAVLLAFDCIAALLFTMSPPWGKALGRLASGASRRPAAFFLLLVGCSLAAYVPMTLVFSPLDWTAWGPFTFQTTRIVHYFVYFVAGIAVGAWGLERGLAAPDGNLARRWVLWALAALVAFGVAAGVAVVTVMQYPTSQAWGLASSVTFVVSCAASSFAFLAVFVRFVRSRSRVFDSLSANSYGIYLVHYAFVNWLQYGLLPAELPAAAKGLVVFSVALALSWLTAAALRRMYHGGKNPTCSHAAASSPVGPSR